ncbi:hypothetical protein [Algoriphagus winogradskyi]|uniref:DUF4377 domain-containing protein n=1 Tax=Algoriphagus winogradskyi TaxID=237017 RepID=A0ABY1NBR3_9BACT|nr:hypothetical protein [Algoriphagus winogradskyi]SMP05564.1 hypothetical protein SAMN06265367_101361 [Algoriphagus winogradskyi]
MRNLFPLFLAISFFTSCTDDSDFENPEGVLIRVENSSRLDFKEILISSGAEPVEFGDVKAGKKSDFKEFESAYRYGFVSLMADGEELRIQPFDYVGETPLSKGYYTYKLGVDESDPENLRLTLELLIVN